jgi:hypothetical protein
MCVQAGRQRKEIPRVPKAATSIGLGPGRSRSAVHRDIEAHVRARKAHGKAVAWEAAAQAEELHPYKIEEARCSTAMAFEEMKEAARNLLICMPTDPRGQVDLLMYTEKNFSVLPLDVDHGASTMQSLPFHFLRTVRLSLRRSRSTASTGRHHEAPSSIAPEAQPTTHRSARQKAQAVTGSRSIPSM